MNLQLNDLKKIIVEFEKVIDTGLNITEFKVGMLIITVKRKEHQLDGVYYYITDIRSVI